MTQKLGKSQQFKKIGAYKSINLTNDKFSYLQDSDGGLLVMIERSWVQFPPPFSRELVFLKFVGCQCTQKKTGGKN